MCQLEVIQVNINSRPIRSCEVVVYVQRPVAKQALCLVLQREDRIVFNHVDFLICRYSKIQLHSDLKRRKRPVTRVEISDFIQKPQTESMYWV